MQSSASPAVNPERISEWLQKEMRYMPLGQYNAGSSKVAVPSIEALQKICRGNMIPIWSFLITRVKSEKTVENLRRNITVHGGSGDAGAGSSSGSGKEEARVRGGRRKEKAPVEGSSAAEMRESALQERDSAAKEVERLRNILRRQRKDLKARMIEVSREEAERKRMLDERANYRYCELSKYEKNEYFRIFHDEETI